MDLKFPLSRVLALRCGAYVYNTGRYKSKNKHFLQRYFIVKSIALLSPLTRIQLNYRQG